MSEVVANLEILLLDAMLRSDVEQLDQLLHDDLTFTDHSGRVLTKQDDLAAHRSGLLRVDSLVPSAQRITVIENVATVTVQLALAGSFDGQEFSGRFAYTRVWLLHGEGGRVVAAHCSPVAG